MAMPDKILVVDDDEQMRNLLFHFLNSKGLSCETATNGREALEALQKEEFDIVITDIKMPELDGISFARELLKVHPDTTVMVMTGFTSEYTEEDALEAGAGDFIKKPFTLVEFSARLQRMLRDRKALFDLKDLAFLGAVTGLPNRKMFFDRAVQSLANGKRYQQVLALFFLDVDNFKAVNDSYGHNAGDLLLKEISVRLLKGLRKIDTIARIAGDEFIVMARIVKPEDAGIIASRMLERLSPPFNLPQHAGPVSCSIGISIFPADGEDIETLMKKADSAMYQAKERGGNNYRFHKENS